MDKKTLNLQKCCNAIVNSNLVEDGVYGSNTQSASNKLRDLINLWYNKKGLGNLPLFEPIGVRMDDKLTDKFTDFLIMATSPTELFAMPISTKPASYLETERKVAILKENRYVNTWQFQNTGWTKLPFFQQVKPVEVYRDNFVDLNITRTAPTEKGLFGINLHSWLNWLQNIVWYKSASRNVALSEGCQVAMADDWQLFIEQIKRKYMLGDYITYNLIHFNDLK